MDAPILGSIRRSSRGSDLKAWITIRTRRNRAGDGLVDVRTMAMVAANGLKGAATGPDESAAWQGGARQASCGHE